jgi:hypothetical protein
MVQAWSCAKILDKMGGQLLKPGSNSSCIRKEKNHVKLRKSARSLNLNRLLH